MARVKFYRDGEGGIEALGMGNRSINIWGDAPLELAWFKKNSSYFQNNIPIFLLSGISNTSIFKVDDVLYWIDFLVMKTFPNVFRGTFCWER